MLTYAAYTRKHNAQVSQILEYRRFSAAVIHRTAYDFLLHTDAGKSLLRPYASMDAKIKEICFQTGLVCELVLPGLLGLCANVSRARLCFRCYACGKEDIYAGLCNHGEKVFHFLHEAGLVQPDGDFVCPPFHSFGPLESSTMPYRTAPAFPFSCYAEIDFAKLLLYAERFGAARLWLTGHSSAISSRYLSILLSQLIYRFATGGYTEEEVHSAFDAFLSSVINQNADIHQAITVEADESLCQPYEILERCCWTQ